ncbi:hypothetical protein [Kitasatospora sp. NPDC097691]|uniref:hypothetical protein n=1 Tax=Kitasatospora sp. NPDC097691 TaxID=3157231 RepID=UPI00331D861A
MTHRIARSIAGALVALAAAVGLTAVASSATAVAAPRTAVVVVSDSGAPAAGAATGTGARPLAASVAPSVASSVVPSSADAVHLAAKDTKKKKGFLAKLGKFLLVVIILVILLFVLLIVGIIYAAKRIFSRRK